MISEFSFREQLASTDRIIGTMSERDQMDTRTAIEELRKVADAHEPLAAEMAIAFLHCERLAAREALKN